MEVVVEVVVVVVRVVEVAVVGKTLDHTSTVEAAVPAAISPLASINRDRTDPVACLELVADVPFWIAAVVHASTVEAAVPAATP